MSFLFSSSLFKPVVIYSICMSTFLQVLIVAVLAIFPLVPKFLSNRAYRLSFMGTACSSLYSLYSLYGVSIPFQIHSLCDLISLSCMCCPYSCFINTPFTISETEGMELAGFASLLSVNNHD